MQYKSDFISISFYIFINLLLGIIAISAGIALWQAGRPGLAAIVLLLIGLQIGLFWLNGRKNTGRYWWLFYYVAQTGMLVLVSILLFQSSVNEVSYLGSSVLCLIGEALGLWGNSRKALLLSLLYFAIALGMFAAFLDQEHFMAVLANMLINGGVIVLLMVSFNQQLIERQKATDLAESLESANAKLAASAARIEALTLQNERQRMARELHDTLAQGLAGLVLQLEAAKAHLAAQRTERTASILEQALTRARSTLGESRAVIDDLRQEAASLSDAIQQQTERFSQATGIACVLELPPELAQLPATIVEQSTKIISEALNNIALHAWASQVIISASMQPGLFVLCIQDNGKGFDTQQNLGTGHYGLLGMYERARLIGGTLQIESTANQGTRIILITPYQ